MQTRVIVFAVSLIVGLTVVDAKIATGGSILNSPKVNHLAFDDFDAPRPWTPLHEFVNVTYNWTGSPWGSEAAAAEAGAYILENNVVTGINFYQKKSTREELVFVCVPRWRPGVPATLATVRYDPEQGKDILQAWPSWEFNTQSVRYVQSVWVDHEKGWMYVIDTGRENMFAANQSLLINGNASLRVLDIETEKEVYYYEFASDIFFPNSSFLNDIVVDQVRNLAYMSDTNVAGLGAVVALNLTSGFAKRFQAPSTMAQEWYQVTILNVTYPVQNPCDGITLSEDGTKLYYSALDGVSLFALDALVFVDPDTTHAQVQATVQNVTNKVSFSDGMRTLPQASLPNGTLVDLVLYGANANNSLAVTVLGRNGSGGSEEFIEQRVLVHNDTTMQWLDTFAYVPSVKGGGYVFFTTNRLQRWFFNTMDFSGAEGANMRIFVFKYGKDQ